MKKRMIILGMVALMLLGVTHVYAQGPGFGPGHRGMGPHQSWGPGEDYPLTPEQKTKFQELRQKFNEETVQLRGAVFTKRLELRSLWTNPKADSKAITDKEKELRDLQNQMKDKMIQLKLEGRKILSPEQLAEFKPGRGMGFGRGHMMGYGQGRGSRGGCGMWQ